MGEPFGMILYPGMRSLAYLAAFRRADVYPSRVVMMESPVPRLEEMVAEARRYRYADTYFDATETPEGFCARHDIPLDRLPVGNINDPALAEHLIGQSESTWIFTGGGILRDGILTSGKRFIHVHPGRLPEYRGSTTFYYSLLAEGTLHATCFYLQAEIDDGPVLRQAAFRVNVRINPDQPNFVDNVLDPYVRSRVLELLLRSWHEGPVPETPPPVRGPQPQPYFVIHPFLRLVTVQRLNRAFRPGEPEGIFMVDG